MSNRLKYETSPYLLQHAENPVYWYPWGSEAFEKATREDKPIFLSIGYSTCHWCHVMAHESFENAYIADILNRYYVCIKVDREERPDVDQVYMSACQAMTGSGGWPTSLFLTPHKKPFFAGTYFPPRTYGEMTGFDDLLLNIAEQWQNNRESLIHSAENITDYLKSPPKAEAVKGGDLLKKAFLQFRQTYDRKNGGFGRAPKFPTPHNLLFLILYGVLKGDKDAENMALNTLTQMRKGGIYDHIGGGFSRYSTDNKFLVPHFEKMLYDNALLIIAYCAAYSASKNDIFLNTAEECAMYVLREMTHSDGGFYSAQDADSEGGEGRYYLFAYDEVISLLGEEKGKKFNDYFGITRQGNFEGANIPNRLHGEVENDLFLEERKMLYEYRRKRMKLHLDDKILTSWNSLMIAALAFLYRVSGKKEYLNAARKAVGYIEANLCEKDCLYVSTREGKRSKKGFLDDYAFYSAAQLALYSATGENKYLESAKTFCRRAVEQFGDENGGFFMNGKENEQLIVAAKETYDGALPSGNSLLAYLFTRLSRLDTEEYWKELWEKQANFLYGESGEYPVGHSMFLISLLFSDDPPSKIVAVCSKDDDPCSILRQLPLYADITLLSEETDEYKLLDGKTAFYVCRNNTCFAPTTVLNTAGVSK